MFKYAYLNNNHPEESMEPKSKKPKIGKMVKIDPSVIEKYHINYNQIQQKQGSPLQTPTKIPILLSNGKPVVAGRDITIRPFVPKGEVMTNTHLQKSSIPIPTSSKQLQLPDTSAKTIFFVKPGTTNISSKAQTGSVSSTYLSSNISPRLQEQKLNMSNATNQMNQTSIKKQCNLRSDIEDTVPKYTSVNAGDIFLDNVQPIRCNAENRSGETKLIGSSQFDGEQITEPTDEENGPVQLADLLAKVDIIESAMERFKIGRDVCVSQMKKALQNFNAAVHMQHVRQSSAANAFETAVDS